MPCWFSAVSPFSTVPLNPTIIFYVFNFQRFSFPAKPIPIFSSITLTPKSQASPQVKVYHQLHFPISWLRTMTDMVHYRPSPQLLILNQLTWIPQIRSHMLRGFLLLEVKQIDFILQSWEWTEVFTTFILLCSSLLYWFSWSPFFSLLCLAFRV